MERFSLTVLRNSSFGIVAQIAVKVLSFIFSVLIIRNLGADSYGQYAAVLAFTGTFAILSDLGLAPYAIRQIARWRDQADGNEKTQELYANVMRLRILLSLLTVITLTAVAFLTRRPTIMIGAIALNSLSLVLYGVQGSSASVLAGFERIDITSGALVLNQFTFVLVGGLLLWLGFGYFGLIAANIIGVGIMAYICWRGVLSLGLFPKGVKLETWFPLLKASLPFGIIGIALGLSYKFDTVLLNIFRSNAETGYYNAAYNLIFSLLIFSNAFNTALYPSLARQAVSSPQELPEVYARILRYLMVLSLPIAAGVSIIADQLVVFLYKSDYLPAVPALKILIWILPLMYTSEFLGYVVVIADKESRVAKALVVSTTINVILNLILVPRYGLIAASIVTVITEAVLVAQYILAVRSQIKRIDLTNNFFLPALSALLMGIVVLILRAYIPVMANIIIGAVVYLFMLVIFRVVGMDEIRFLNNLRSGSENVVIEP